MNRSCYTVAYLLLLTLATGSSAQPISIVATTSLLGELLREVGGIRVQVTVLIPPTSCPGHFDLRPRDIAAIQQSGILFAHSFEPFAQRVTKLPGKPVRVFRVTAKGNWLVPSVYAQAIQEATTILCQIDPDGAPLYKRNAKQALLHVREVEKRLQSRLHQAGVVGTPVVGAAMVEPLLRWMGLKVVATYPRQEELTPARWNLVGQVARRAQVRLVIDNLQSGAHTGSELARDLRAQHVVLSNFPGGLPSTPTWERCLSENVQRVIEAVGRYSQR